MAHIYDTITAITDETKHLIDSLEENIDEIKKKKKEEKDIEIKLKEHDELQCRKCGFFPKITFINKNKIYSHM
jgi:hypothetical protein